MLSPALPAATKTIAPRDLARAKASRNTTVLLPPPGIIDHTSPAIQKVVNASGQVDATPLPLSIYRSGNDELGVFG